MWIKIQKILIQSTYELFSDDIISIILNHSAEQK